MSNMIKAVNLGASGFTRRKFLRGLAIGAGAASLGSYEAVAQMVAGPRARPVRGWGVPEGLVRLSSNENPIGPSPRAVEAIMQYVYKFNRYYRGGVSTARSRNGTDCRSSFLPTTPLRAGTVGHPRMRIVRDTLCHRVGLPS